MGQLTNIIDIREDEIRELSEELLDVLLVDHTMSRLEKKRTGNDDVRVNIMWCTKDYEHLGDGFECHSQIKPELITGVNGNVIMPRVLKSKDNQIDRSKQKAEVFTPSWICNAQNNLVDEAWFDRKNVFNREVIDKDGNHTWKPTKAKIKFPTKQGKTWQDYVKATRMEMSCGEAPYIVSRYDTTTGEPLPIEMRIGLLDRKLRVISENVDDSTEWLKMAQLAYMNTYGFEWQGDNLLLARENLLYTLIDYYEAKFGKKPIVRSLKYIAYIISWNIWQMDGLKMVVPDSCDNVYETNMYGEQIKKQCPACKSGSRKGHIGVKCLIRDWTCRNKTKRDITFESLIKQ